MQWLPRSEKFVNKVNDNGNDNATLCGLGIKMTKHIILSVYIMKMVTVMCTP